MTGTLRGASPQVAAFGHERHIGRSADHGQATHDLHQLRVAVTTVVFHPGSAWIPDLSPAPGA